MRAFVLNDFAGRHEDGDAADCGLAAFSPCFGSLRVGSLRLEALPGTGSVVCSRKHLGHGYLDEFVAKSAHPLKHPQADSVRYDSYPYGGYGKLA